MADTPTKKGNFLTKKMGPLPAYAWLILAAGAFFVYYRMKGGSATSSTTSTSTSAQTQADQEAEASNEYMSSELASALSGLSSEGMGYGYGGGGWGVSPGNGAGTTVSPGNTTTTTTTGPQAGVVGSAAGDFSLVPNAAANKAYQGAGVQQYAELSSGVFTPVTTTRGAANEYMGKTYVQVPSNG